MDGEHPKESAPTLEHVIPISRRGTEDPGNLVAACLGCNNQRSATFRDEHRQALAAVCIRRADGTARQEAPDA